MNNNRRTFLQSAGVTAAASFLNLNQRAFGANEKPVLALIGGHNQGLKDARRAIQAGAIVKTSMRR